MTASTPSPKTPSATTEAAVEQAERRVGAVLQDLESETGSDVQDIGLDDMVDTDPATGKPVLRKGVDIDVRKRPERSWVR
jgi:hypothetical protein